MLVIIIRTEKYLVTKTRMMIHLCLCCVLPPPACHPWVPFLLPTETGHTYGSLPGWSVALPTCLMHECQTPDLKPLFKGLKRGRMG